MDKLTFTISTDSKIPIYQQLYSFIKAEILSGRITCNTKLPSKRKLSAYLKISQNTIQTAYEQLIEEGYVVPIEKKGFYVSKIDHMIQLENISHPENTAGKTEGEAVEFDFSYHGVDMQTFPFSAWRKLTRDVINEYDRELLQAGDPQGNYDLRHAIAGYLHHSRGVNCTADQVIISSGTEYLMQTLIQLFDRKSIYAIENPGYEKLNLLFASSHARFEAVDIDEGGMILDEIIKSRANILCITPAHQFPSGEIMPINRRIQILNWANEYPGRYIIEDDYDSEFKYSGKPVPALQGLDSNSKVIYMGAFSKSLSPALRISYMVLPVHLLQEYIRRLSFLFCPVPVMEQKVLCKYMQNGYFERHLNKMRNIYKRKREVLVNRISELNCGMQVSGADAGLHLLLRANNGMSEEQLTAAAFKKGVKVYGISKYYFNKEHIGGTPTILIGYATMSEAEISLAVTRLYEAWF